MTMELPYALKVIQDAEVYKMKLMKVGLLNIRNFDKIIVSPEIYQQILASRFNEISAPIEPILSIRGYKFLIDFKTKGISYLMEDVS